MVHRRLSYKQEIKLQELETLDSVQELHEQARLAQLSKLLIVRRRRKYNENVRPIHEPFHLPHNNLIAYTRTSYSTLPLETPKVETTKITKSVN